MNSEIYVNLGCGLDHKNGWVNIDALASVKPDIIHDIREELPFESEVVEQVLCQDILEHFTREEVPQIISEISRILKSGGRLEVRIPNLDEIIKKFSNDKEVRNEFLYGTTAKTGVFGAHKVGFTPISLVSQMLLHSLVLESMHEVDTNLVAIFKKDSNIQKSLKVKKIAFVTQTFGMGGAEVFNTDLLESFQEKDIRVQAFTNFLPLEKIFSKSKIPSQNIPVFIDFIGDWKGLLKSFIFFPRTVFFYGKLAWKLRNAVESVLISGFSEKIIFTPFAKFLGIPVVWLEFGPLESVFKKFYFFPKFLYRMVKDLPEMVVVPSENTKKHLLSSARISLSKITVIPCGRNIVAQEYKKIPVNRQLTIVCVSRLERGKGQDLLLSAFKKISQNNVKLLVIGEGDFATSLQRIIEKNSLQRSVILVGRVPDALEYIKKSHICVFPSQWELEGFGLVVVEAMALGKPVVAFNRGPTNEIITDGVNGLLADNGSIESLAAKLQLLIESQKLREKIGKKAAKDFRRRYGISKISDQYIEMLREVNARNYAQKLLTMKAS